MIINLTNRDVTICDKKGNITATYEAKSDSLPKVRTSITQVGTADGISLTKVTGRTVSNLPDQKDGTFYIVARNVQEACPDRSDLLIPVGIVKAPGGKIVGFTGFGVL